MIIPCVPGTELALITHMDTCPLGVFSLVRQAATK